MSKEGLGFQSNNDNNGRTNTVRKSRDRQIFEGGDALYRLIEVAKMRNG
jgi:hypothetical protein